MDTPNGRYKQGTFHERGICMTMSDWHPESWNPSWKVVQIITSIQTFMVFYEISKCNSLFHLVIFITFFYCRSVKMRACITTGTSVLFPIALNNVSSMLKIRGTSTKTTRISEKFTPTFFRCAKRATALTEHGKRFTKS